MLDILMLQAAEPAQIWLIEYREIVSKMNQKIAIVTGATSGIGFEMAKGLASEDCRVIIACRNLKKAGSLVAEIISKSGNAAVEALPLELESLDSVKAFVSTFRAKYEKLDILINNAGVFADTLKSTKNGFELTMGVNYLGPFLLTRLLLPLMIAAPGARIVNVTSRAGLYGKIKVDENTFSGNKASFKAYSASKLAQMFFTIELADELKGKGVTVNAAHPGRIATNIWQGERLLTNIVAKFIMRKSVSPETGAKTGLYLALSPEVAGVSGKLYHEKEVLDYSQACLDGELRKALSKASFEAVAPWLNDGQQANRPETEEEGAIPDA